MTSTKNALTVDVNDLPVGLSDVPAQRAGAVFEPAAIELAGPAPWDADRPRDPVHLNGDGKSVQSSTTSAMWHCKHYSDSVQESNVDSQSRYRGVRNALSREATGGMLAQEDRDRAGVRSNCRALDQMWGQPTKLLS